jgi:hypothetical protein
MSDGAGTVSRVGFRRRDGGGAITSEMEAVRGGGGGGGGVTASVWLSRVRLTALRCKLSLLIVSIRCRIEICA